MSEIAFIPDSDVGRDSDVSETGNIPVSASRRKLDVDVDVEVDSEEEYEFKDTKGSAAGYRLVYIESLRDLVQRIHTDSCEGEIIYPPITRPRPKAGGRVLKCNLFVFCFFFFGSTSGHTVADCQVPVVSRIVFKMVDSIVVVGLVCFHWKKKHQAVEAPSHVHLSCTPI